MSPIMATPRALPICRVVVMMPAPAPASWGARPAITVPTSGLIPSPLPRPAMNSEGASSKPCRRAPAANAVVAVAAIPNALMM